MRGRGRILFGRSFLGPEFQGGFVFEQVGPREDGRFFMTFDSHGQPTDVSAVFQADMAFLTLAGFACNPEGPLRQVDVEVHGVHYDGQRFVWELGGGVSTTEHAIEGRLGPALGERHGLFGWPRFVGILRHDRRPPDIP